GSSPARGSLAARFDLDAPAQVAGRVRPSRAPDGPPRAAWGGGPGPGIEASRRPDDHRRAGSAGRGPGLCRLKESSLRTERSLEASFRYDAYNRRPEHQGLLGDP